MQIETEEKISCLRKFRSPNQVEFPESQDHFNYHRLPPVFATLRSDDSSLSFPARPESQGQHQGHSSYSLSERKITRAI